MHGSDAIDCKVTSDLAEFLAKVGKPLLEEAVPVQALLAFP
jgi:hypothetical protein